MGYRTTEHALVAIFSDRSTAEAAVGQLTAHGFESNQVEVSATNDIARRAAAGNTGLTGTPHDTSGGAISGFFHRLFGSETDVQDRGDYRSASRRGKVAVIVHADDASLDRAANILTHNGAIEVESREGEIRGDATAGTLGPVVRVYSSTKEPPASEQIELKEERVRVDRRRADRPATEADLAAAEREVIEVTETAEEPVISKRSRVTEEVVVDKEVTSRTEKVRDARPDPIDADFRNDYQNRFASDLNLRYEDFAPAYRYGYEMASDPRYKSGNFDDVADDLKTDYMRHNPNSAWEKMKGAVRYGWEKVTGKR